MEDCPEDPPGPSRVGSLLGSSPCTCQKPRKPASGLNPLLIFEQVHRNRHDRCVPINGRSIRHCSSTNGRNHSKFALEPFCNTTSTLDMHCNSSEEVKTPPTQIKISPGYTEVSQPPCKRRRKQSSFATKNGSDRNQSGLLPSARMMFVVL